MELIEWTNIQSTQQLITSLEQFLKEVFRDRLREEVQKLHKWIPKGKPESFEYLRPVNVHRAAKWYVIIQKLKERGYSFDLRFSMEIEEFQSLLLFAYALDLLARSNALSLDDSRVRGALLDRSRFEALIYEVLVAANYASNDFKVELPDVLGTGRVDVYARKGNVEVYAECKRLRRSEKYVDVAIKAMRSLSEQRFCGIVDVTVKKVPRTNRDLEEIVKLIEKIIAGDIREASHEQAIIRTQKLPKIIENIYEISIPQPENVEFLASSSYVGVFNGVFKVKEPKIIIVRNPDKREKIEKQLLNELGRAREQLKSVEAYGGMRKVIYVDVSDVAGRPILQLPELIGTSIGPEILGSYLEQKSREWLSEHPGIDAIVLTQNKLYLDQLGYPYAMTVENKPVLAYIAPGWAIETMIIPVPRDASPEVLVNLGVEMVKRGNYRLAEFYYRKAIDSKPDLKEAWNNLGRLYTEFLGRPDIGLKYLERALEIDPSYTSALINKGIALAMLGRYTEALRELDKALRLDPRQYKAWYNKAFIHFILGQYDEAYRSCSRSLELKPDYTPAKKLMEELKRRG